MCDTFALGPAYTAGSTFIFAKNSDREPGETHLVIFRPTMQYNKGESIRCTYIIIPQINKTHAVILCKPFWIWGAEMGVNDKGVVIGNEALFTKQKPEKTPGLIGMDLLRLALERADTAEKAAHTIIELMKRYGQGGPCGYRDKRFTYMNSYLIMDRKEILVLETIGRDYALKSYKDYAAISNIITLGSAMDERSFAADVRLDRLADPFMTYFSGARYRRASVMEQINNLKGKFTHKDAFAILRSHYPGSRSPAKGSNRDVCMHAADPLIRKSQTTGSLVVALDKDKGFKIFVTAGSCPCMSTFKPLMPAAENGLPAGIDSGGDAFSKESWWWRHEMFHISMLFYYKSLYSSLHEDILELESGFDVPFYPWDAKDENLINISRSCFELTEDMERNYLNKIDGLSVDSHMLYNWYWNRIAKRQGVPLDIGC